MPNIYVLVVALVGLVATGFYSYSAGESAAEGKHAIADRIAQEKFDAALAKANFELRAKEQAFVNDSARASAEYQRL